MLRGASISSSLSLARFLPLEAVALSFLYDLFSTVGESSSRMDVAGVVSLDARALLQSGVATVLGDAFDAVGKASLRVLRLVAGMMR